MWALCQRLKAEKGIDDEDGSDSALPTGNLVARGKDLRGTKPYFIRKLSADRHTISGR